MGFIERIQKQQEEQARLEALKQEEERKKQEEQKRAEEARKQRVEEERLRAQHYFNQSIYPWVAADMRRIEPYSKLIITGYNEEEWRSVVGPRGNEESGFYDFRNCGDKGYVKIEIQWDFTRAFESESHKYIKIKCDSQGTIFLKGDQCKECLPFDKWRNDSDLQDRVLEEVYKRPLTYKFTYEEFDWSR